MSKLKNSSDNKRHQGRQTRGLNEHRSICVLNNESIKYIEKYSHKNCYFKAKQITKYINIVYASMFIYTDKMDLKGISII